MEYRDLSLRLFLLLPFLILALFGPLSAHAGPLEDGRAAMDRMRYEEAFRLLRPLAEHGNAEAQTLVGRMYQDGSGVAASLTEAISWYQKAAAQRDASAMLNLCWIHATEIMGHAAHRPDAAAAAIWCERAGEGLRRQAEQGDVEAMTKLAELYRRGLGGFKVGNSKEMNEAEMIRWYEAAILRLDALTKGGTTGDRRRLTAVILDFASRQKEIGRYADAQRLYSRAAALGDSFAQKVLADIYVESRPAEALQLYLRSARQGDREAQESLVRLYLEGIGTNRDPVQAYAWLEILARRPDPGDVSAEFSMTPEEAAAERDALGRRLTSAQLQEARRLASSFRPVREMP